MAKNSRELVRERVARKRQRARDAGLCYFCCKQKPKSGRTVCVSCRSAKSASKRRSRQAKREASGDARLIAAHERAGDVACEHHFYEAAVQHYEDALQLQNTNLSEQLPLIEKLVRVLFLGNDPGTANRWYDRIASLSPMDPKNTRKTGEILLHAARQLHTDSKTEATIPLLSKIVKLAEAIDDCALRKIALVNLLGVLNLLGRYRESEQILGTIPDIHEHDDVGLRVTYYMNIAILAATHGDAIKAYEAFEHAIHVAEDDADTFRVASVWINYGSYAVALGDIKLAKGCTERALLITQQHKQGWRIPFTYLAYADILTIMGQYDVAYQYLLDALTYDVNAPVMDEMFAEIGIPLALCMNDEVTLAKCARFKAIALAFQSGEHARIGPVATAFAQFYIRKGQKRKAEDLLRQAIGVVNNVGQSWGLPIEVARHGAYAEIPGARRLLEVRTSLPSSDVAFACLNLFDAFAMLRKGHTDRAYKYAAKAMKQFQALDWHHYANLACSLLPTPPKSAPNATTAVPFEMQPMLTKRERQVASLVIQGLTNRQIATSLSLKERTVEAHLTSIMSHFGIRSRHQLRERYTDRI